MDENLTFTGAWTELYSKHQNRWCFPASGEWWKYNADERTLRIHHINQRDDLYLVRRLTEDNAMLTDLIDHHVTFLQR